MAQENLITKAMRYEIIKPINTSWKEFGELLYSLQKQCAKIANYDIQLLWQWDAYCQDYIETKRQQLRCLF